jgi:transposase
MAVARALDMSSRTAYRIINTQKTANDPRGGRRPSLVKVTPEMVDFLIEQIEKRPTWTLEHLKASLDDQFGVQVSTTTISNYVHGCLYTMKDLRIETDVMNSEVNIEKRRLFALKIREHMNNGDMIVYIDETNFNVHLKRTKAWAQRGARATEQLPSTRAPNLQVLCAVSALRGVVHYETHRGSVQQSTMNDFLYATWEKIVSTEAEPMPHVVFVLDNAPCHRGVEDVFESLELTLLKLGPYSPMLNPIENCFSVYKAMMKTLLDTRRTEFSTRGSFPSIPERRLCIMEELTATAITVITPDLVYNCERHCQAATIQASHSVPMVFGE